MLNEEILKPFTGDLVVIIINLEAVGDLQATPLNKPLVCIPFQSKYLRSLGRDTMEGLTINMSEEQESVAR